MHSNFTLKTTLFWLITKLKVQNLIHFFISHLLSQNQKFKSLMLLFIFLYIFVVLLVYSQSVMELLFLLYICVTFFVTHVVGEEQIQAHKQFVRFRAEGPTRLCSLQAT